MIVSFWRKVFSKDYRKAEKAERDGELSLAASLYGEAGESEKAIDLQIQYAQTIEDKTLRIKALEEAFMWVGDDESASVRLNEEIAKLKLNKLEKEQVVTEEDKKEVMEVAEHFAAAGDTLKAGELAEEQGDMAKAADYYEKGGHIDRLEHALGMEQHSKDVAQERTSAVDDYHFYMKTGQRRKAREALRKCIEDSSLAHDFRQVLADLDSRLLGDTVTFASTTGDRWTVTKLPSVLIGRDPRCDYAISDQNLSRKHASIERRLTDGEFVFRDLGSRNGSKLSGIPVSGSIELPENAVVELGNDTSLEIEVHEGVLLAKPKADSKNYLIVMPEGKSLPGSKVGLPFDLLFEDDMPQGQTADDSITFNAEVIADGRFELLRGDVVVGDGEEIKIV